MNSSSFTTEARMSMRIIRDAGGKEEERLE